MQTYWDYTEQERAVLTEEEVKSLLDVELMTKGVKKPVAPTLAEVPKSPVGERRKYYGLVGKGKYGTDEHFSVCFDSIDRAEAFLALQPLRRDYDYEVGHEFEYAVPVTDAKIDLVPLYALDQINEFRSELKNRKAKTEANNKALSEFTKASEKAENVTKGVWEDWFRQRETHATLKGIVDTYQEYLRLTENNSDLALTFLGKAHRLEHIEEARQWFPNTIPATTQEAKEEP